ncbi:MAG TPA: outer membrane beta-barrel protein [Gemmatimonadaceae bacterium]|nr:outer membrane beta-barrel protein [Gemmatimonadaceae bacterium]
MKRLSSAFALAAGALLLFAVSPALAQAPVRSGVFHVTPYAGYMVFGDYFTGPLGVSLTNKSAPVFGAQLGVDVTRNVSVIGHVGYSRPDWAVSAPIVGSVGVGEAGLLLADGGLEFRLPVGGSAGASAFTPVIQAGAGVIRHSIRNLPLDIDATSTDFAGNVGAGVDLALSPHAGLRLMAKDYIGKLDVKPLEALGFESKVAHSIAFSAGVTLRF